MRKLATTIVLGLIVLVSSAGCYNRIGSNNTGWRTPGTTPPTSVPCVIQTWPVRPCP